VGFGSFYNHFESKDALVEALIRDLLEALSDTIDAATASIDDPLAILAVAFRTLHRAAERDPVVAGFVLRAAFVNDRLLDGLLARTRRDVVRAVDAGSLSLPDVDLAVLMLSGASLVATRGVLDKRVKKGRDSEIAAMLLRLLGVSPARAAALANAPLPTRDA
jgi:AcrR family transcriptional regulator